MKFDPFENDVDLAVMAIISRTNKMVNFWTNCRGWAPPEAADLLSESRLQRQKSLTYCLRNARRKHPADEDEGQLVLAWANLGSLVEGALKLTLAVYINDYKKQAEKDIIDNFVSPVKLSFDDLLKFFRKNQILNSKLIDWAQHIKDTRNSIHIFADKKLWTWERFQKDVVTFSNFLNEIDSLLPYPN